MIELNKIYCGDCLEVMKEIQDKSIDMILCDLPYGTTACHWDVVIPFEPLWVQYKRIIKDNGAIALFGSQPFSSMLVISNLKMFKYEWTWNKRMVTNIAMDKKQPLRTTEQILMFYKKQPIYKPILDNSKTIGRFGRLKNSISLVNGNLGKDYNDKVGYPKNLITFPRPNNLTDGGFHPTQKPVLLCEYLIKTYTNENELVLDNCAGSGTTGVACINTNRNFILIEKERKYCDIAERRIKEAQSQIKLFGRAI